MDYLTFEERVARYSKWTIEELARELAYRDMTYFEPIRIPAPEPMGRPLSQEWLITPNTGTPPNPYQFNTTCSCNIHRDKDC